MNAAARSAVQTRFTALLHQVDVAALERAFRRQKRQASAGVDGITVADYERTLDELERALAPERLALAVEIASIPASIRGYGHVKRRHLDAAKAREAELLARFRAPAAKPLPVAA